MVGDKGSLDRLIAVVGKPSIHVRIIPHEDGTLIVDLLNDAYALLEKTTMKSTNLTDIYQVVFVGKWSDIVKMAHGKPPILDH